MTEQLLKALAITSLTGSALTLFITLIKPLTKRIFGYKWHYYIWLTVLIVMILPVRFTLPNEHNISDPTITVKIQPSSNNGMKLTDGTQDMIITPNAAPHSPIKEGTKFLTQIIENKANTISVVWLVGLFIVLSVNVIGYFRLIHKVQKKSVIISCPEIQNYIKRKITVRTCKDLTSPFIMGIFHPSLILPDTELTQEQLDNILMHETTHLNRNDILYKWFLSVVKAIHWFNPVVYYLSKQINAECEISCDLSVVKNMNDIQTESYVNTIISLLSAERTKSIPLTTGMTGSKKILMARFLMIKNRFAVKKQFMLISAVSAVLIFVLTISTSGFLNGKFITFNDSIKHISYKPNKDNMIPEYKTDYADSDSITQTEAPTLPEDINETPAVTAADTPLPINTAQAPDNITGDNASIGNTQLEKSEAVDNSSTGVDKRMNFSSIADAEKYLQSGGVTEVDKNSFKSGSNYIVNDYSFENSRKEKIHDISSNINGEVSIYFVSNTNDSLMNVSFKDSQTNDEVHSAVILTGNERIYKFTGLDPSKNYEIELTDMTDGDYQVDGQYIIF